ncbi:MAG: LEA type 2 family protein [Treponema sp.]|jgi:LEA14-like dessication related protein|nr:LEA type 2 family protein [Treponema sp.]
MKKRVNKSHKTEVLGKSWLPRFAAAALVMLAVCLSSSSCRTFGAAFRQPGVFLHSVDIAAINLQGIQLICSMEVENPNSFDLPFPEIDWEIFINDSSFLSGAVTEGQVMGPGSSRIPDIRLDLDYTALVGAAGSSGDLKEIEYQLVLETRFLLPVQGEWIANFEHQGKLPLVQMISFRDPSFEITNLDFNGLDVTFSMNVDNPNLFPIPFPDISYNYEVRNNGYITGMVGHPDLLQAGILSPVNIRLRIEYSDLYRSFSVLKTIGEAACLLSLSSRISLPGFSQTRLFMDIPGILPLLKTPVVSFKGISVKAITLSKIDFEFGWNVNNPNIFSFEAEDIRYGFLVNDTFWVQDRLIEGVTKIAPGTETIILATVTINTPSLVKELTDIITKGKDVSYNLKGAMTIFSGPAGFSGSSMSFDLNGRIRPRLNL